MSGAWWACHWCEWCAPIRWWQPRWLATLAFQWHLRIQHPDVYYKPWRQ